MVAHMLDFSAVVCNQFFVSSNEFRPGCCFVFRIGYQFHSLVTQAVHRNTSHARNTLVRRNRCQNLRAGKPIINA